MTLYYKEHFVHHENKQQDNFFQDSLSNFSVIRHELYVLSGYTGQEVHEFSYLGKNKICSLSENFLFPINFIYYNTKKEKKSGFPELFLIISNQRTFLRLCSSKHMEDQSTDHHQLHYQ